MKHSNAVFINHLFKSVPGVSFVFLLQIKDGLCHLHLNLLVMLMFPYDNLLWPLLPSILFLLFQLQKRFWIKLTFFLVSPGYALFGSLLCL